MKKAKKQADPIFSLMDVVDAVESATEEFQYFANIQTGEIDCLVDRSFSGEDYDEFKFDGVEWLRMPDRYDRDDWGALRDYAYALGGAAGDELLDAIHGNGAFRNFRRSVERMGALQSWYAFKDERILRIALEWLNDNNLSWEDDLPENWKRDWHALLPDSLRLQLQMVVLDYALSVCKLESLPANLMDEAFFCITRTDDELSVVCESDKAPENALAREDGLRALKVLGPLDFGLIGILAKISTTLADANVPLFAVSTFDTDYILVKEEHLENAIAALRDDGCDVQHLGR